MVGGLLLFVGLSTLYVSLRLSPPNLVVVAASFALLGIASLVLRSAFVRWNGKNIEQSSIKRLSFPEGWTVTPNYQLPKGGGDVDLVVENPRGELFAVEIKSFENIVLRRGFFGIGAGLFKADGKSLGLDAINQARKNAQALSATPVLWCPQASKHDRGKLKGVIVALGPKRQLYKSLKV